MYHDKRILFRGSFFYAYGTTAKSTSFATLSRHDFLVDNNIIMCYFVLQERGKEAILIGDTTSIRLTEEDKARIDKISKIIYDETQIVVTSSEIIRLGLRKLEKDYQKE